VSWVIKRIKGGLADELKGLNEKGGKKSLKYAVELLEEWAQEGRNALEQDAQEDTDGTRKKSK